MDKIENYTDHRERFISKGRVPAFQAAVHQMDEYLSQPTVFRTNAHVNRVQIKTEHDIEIQLNIKQEKGAVKRPPKVLKPQDKSCASWKQEKQNLVQQIVSLKAESQKTLLELRNKQLECASLSEKIKKQEQKIGTQVSELDTLKKTLTNLSSNQAEKNINYEKIISDLSSENQLLQARTKQLQTGIAQHAQLKENQRKSAENDVYEVDNILEQKKQSGVWFYKIRWKNFGPEHDTWEKESNLNCHKLLKAFKQSLALNKKIKI